MKNCVKIAICGRDRVGKATQSKLLVKFLLAQGNNAIRIETPVRDRHTYKVIYWMLENGLAKKLPTFFQCLQVLNRMIFQKFSLPKIVEKYDYIIFDRWAMSTWVYGKATGVPEKTLAFLCRRVFEPNFTVILDGDPHVKEVRDSYEADSALQTRVRDLYVSKAINKPCCTVLINANQSQKEVSDCIIKELEFRGMIQV
jgi:thymidylate kinase